MRSCINGSHVDVVSYCTEWKAVFIQSMDNTCSHVCFDSPCIVVIAYIHAALIEDLCCNSTGFCDSVCPCRHFIRIRFIPFVLDIPLIQCILDYETCGWRRCWICAVCSICRNSCSVEISMLVFTCYFYITFVSHSKQFKHGLIRISHCSGTINGARCKGISLWILHFQINN